MKKLLCVIIACLLLIFTCGCSKNVLQFESLWGGNSVGYTETLVYDVSYSPDFSEGSVNFSKSSSMKATCDFTGKYTVTTKILSSNSSDLPEKVLSSEIISKSGGKIIMITSTLNLTSTYTVNDQTSTFTDSVFNTTYMFTETASLSPIYSTGSYDYTLFYANIQDKFRKVHGEYVNNYGETSYTSSLSSSNEPDKNATSTEKEYEYELGTIIDNGSLLFALRNLDISAEIKRYIPTVSPSYGDAQELEIKHIADRNINVSVNGTDLEMPIKSLSFCINDTKKSGLDQVVFVQTAKAGNIENHSLIVKYVEPITEYSNLNLLGSLVYNLESVS